MFELPQTPEELCAFLRGGQAIYPVYVHGGCTATMVDGYFVGRDDLEADLLFRDGGPEGPLREIRAGALAPSLHQILRAFHDVRDDLFHASRLPLVLRVTLEDEGTRLAVRGGAGVGGPLDARAAAIVVSKVLGGPVYEVMSGDQVETDLDTQLPEDLDAMRSFLADLAEADGVTTLPALVAKIGAYYLCEPHERAVEALAPLFPEKP